MPIIEPSWSEEEKEQRMQKWRKYYELSAKSLTTQGRMKAKRLFEEILLKDEFQKQVGRIRHKYGYPKNGTPPSQQTRDDLNSGEAILNIEDDEYEKELAQLCFEFGLLPEHWLNALNFYVSFNEVLEMSSEDSRDVCFVDDSLWDDSQKTAEEKLLFPVSIRLGAYASERDITDFIRKNMHIILDYQESAQDILIQRSPSRRPLTIKSVRTRKKAIQERNDFIYEHRHLPRREIMNLLMEQRPGEDQPDQAYIGKIISLEKKKRKDV